MFSTTLSSKPALTSSRAAALGAFTRRAVRTLGLLLAVAAPFTTLAACDQAPCALIGKDMYFKLTPTAVDVVLDHVEKGGRGGTLLTVPGGGDKIEPHDHLLAQGGA